ncbi:MAG: hypothetical protein ABEH40_09100 [Haloferacaceae archaeon]
MATETGAGLSDHLRGVTVTTAACLAGTFAALTSAAVVGTSTAAATDTRALVVLAGFVIVQYPVFRAVGIDVQEFGAKDHLYVAFMTFALWFMTFTILLTAGVSI